MMAKVNHPKRNKEGRKYLNLLNPSPQVPRPIGGEADIQGIIKHLDKKAILTQTEIAWLWIQEGGSGDKADEASAVSMAESSGKTKAHTPGSCCYGIYQFHHSYFPVACALKPSCATRMAIKLSANGTSWDDGKWEAHENGSYKKFLGKSSIASSNLPNYNEEKLGNGLAIGGFGIGDIVKFVARLFEPSFWLRVGKGIMGFLLLLFGALTLMKVLTGIDVPLAGPTGFLKKQVASTAGA